MKKDPESGPEKANLKLCVRDFLAVLWLRLLPSTAGGMGSIPGWENYDLTGHMVWSTVRDWQRWLPGRGATGLRSEE